VKKKSIELKACPFCGGNEVEVRHEIALGRKCYFVSCDTDKCAMNIESASWQFTKKEAIQAWNRRAK